MSINDYMVDKVSRISTIQKTKRSKTKEQSQGNFAKTLKKTAAKVNLDNHETIDAHSEKNPFNGELGNA